MGVYANTAEQSIIAALIKNPALIKNVVTQLHIDDFGFPPNVSIYKAIFKCETDGKPVDTATVINTIVETENKNPEKVSAYLTKILSIDIDEANLSEWVRIVIKHSKLSKLRNAANNIISETDKNPDIDPVDLQNRISAEMSEIMKTSATKGPVSFDDATKIFFDRLYKLSGPERAKYVGISTGFKDLDRMIGGLNRSDLILIGARPSMGKTALGLNIASHVAIKEKKRVLFFSLEMSAEQLAQRFYACETRIPISRFRDGRLTDAEWRELNNAARTYVDSPLIIDDEPNVNPTAMKAKIKQVGNVDLVIVDYLSLMKSGIKTENRVQEVSQITRDLKIMAKELEIPVVVLSQLNRSVEARSNANHKPQLADLRESGSIEQDADIVMMLYRDDYYKKDEYVPYIKDGVELQVAQILVRKNRHGPCGDVNLVWIPAWTKFDDCPDDMEVK